MPRREPLPDYENRLMEVKQEASNGVVLNDEKFTYDVFGNRISVSLNGTQQLYTVYDGYNPYIDFNGSGTLTERYLTNPGGLNQFYSQVSANGTTEWFLTDNLGSIRQVVSTSGKSLDAITYDPYGNIVNQANSANAPRFLYAGGAYDPITGVDLFNYRPYGPAIGRFLIPDPSKFAAGDTNLYRYVLNRPIDTIDPSGLAPVSWNGYWNIKLGHIALATVAATCTFHFTGTSLAGGTKFTIDGKGKGIDGDNFGFSLAVQRGFR